jgi:uncharacterized protein YjbI with pentapeptide repeats
MLGLRFDTCNEFGLIFKFEGCILNHSSFHKTKIRRTIFKNTQMIEVDFSQCDLSNVMFDDCDLSRAVFENSILEHTDFTSAYNYSFDPEKNKMKKAKFSMAGVPGLLMKYGIEIKK